MPYPEPPDTCRVDLPIGVECATCTGRICNCSACETLTAERNGQCLPCFHARPLTGVVDPTAPRVGDVLTHLNYRPGIHFRHEAYDTDFVTESTVVTPGRYGDGGSFVSTPCRTWHLGHNDLRITAVLDLATRERRPVTSHRDVTLYDQDTALVLRERGMSWNDVAERMGWPTTTPAGYSVARWAAYQARQHRGDYFRPAPGRPYQPRVGIEIEFNRASDDTYGDRTASAVLELAQEAEIPCESEDYGHRVPARWTMRPDCTVSGGEFISPPLPATDEGYAEIATALQSVRDAGGRPGTNQGMHVHHDVTDLRTPAIRRLVDTLRAWQGAIMAAVPTSRYSGSNDYGAYLLDSHEWQRLRDTAASGAFQWSGRQGRRGGLMDRYRSFNFDATLAYGTVEFRGLGNTLNTQRVIAWARVTGAVVQYVRDGNPVPQLGEDTGAMLAALGSAGLIDASTARTFLGMVTPDRREAVRNTLFSRDPEAVPIAA